jgi:chromosome partitioning protein
VITITCTSLSGGQGKTTLALFLGKFLAKRGYRVLWVDADPQSSLTLYTGLAIESDQPTLLEVVTGKVEPIDGIYRIEESTSFLIPSDNGLEKLESYLPSTGTGAIILGRRLEPLSKAFDICIIDSPPGRTQLCVSAIGAASGVLIPAEAGSKGLNSVIRTMEMLDELTSAFAFRGKILGVVPFRDRWTGLNQALQSRKSIEAIQEWVNPVPVLPSILESEKYKRALDARKMPSEMGYADLEFPFEKIAQLLEDQCLITMSLLS